MINILDQVSKNDLLQASTFVKENLGLILRNDKNYYKDLYVVKKMLLIKWGLHGLPIVTFQKMAI